MTSGSGNAITSWTSHHHEYLLIATSQLKSESELQKRIDKLDAAEAKAVAIIAQHTGRTGAMHDDLGPMDARRFQLLEEQALHVTEAIVFAALCAEAYINYYVTRKKSAKFLENYLDKLSPDQKWYVIPPLLNNEQSLDPGREPLQGLGQLIRVRNRVVHSKPSSQTIGAPGVRNHRGRYDGPSLKLARDGVSTARSLMRHLAAIDSLVDGGWLTSSNPGVLFMNFEENGHWASGL